MHEQQEQPSSQSSPLRASREARAMTQVQVAARAGVSVSKLSRAETTGIVSAKMARKIARALRVPAVERIAWRAHAVASRAERLVAENGPTLAALIAEVRRAAHVDAPALEAGAMPTTNAPAAAETMVPELAEGAEAATGERN